MTGFFDDFSEDGDATFVFERLDRTGGPRLIVSTLHRSDYSRHFRALNAKHPIRLMKFDPRPSNHPGVLAEHAELRARLQAARTARQRAGAQSGGAPVHG